MLPSGDCVENHVFDVILPTSPTLKILPVLLNVKLTLPFAMPASLNIT